MHLHPQKARGVGAYSIAQLAECRILSIEIPLPLEGIRSFFYGASAASTESVAGGIVKGAEVLGLRPPK